MNTCQALVNPDSSKPTVQKSSGIKKILSRSLWYTFDNLKLEDVPTELAKENLVLTGDIPTINVSQKQLNMLQ